MSSILVIGAVKSEAMPSLETNEEASQPPPQINNPWTALLPAGLNEAEIDNAVQMFVKSISQCNSREIKAKITPDTLKRVMDYLSTNTSSICPSCHEIFEQLAAFQVHFQTCTSPPRADLKLRMDQAAMDDLARALFKGVFLKLFKEQLPNRQIDEVSVHTQLDEVWKTDGSPEMVTCRELWILSAVDIASAKWFSTDEVNEHIRVMTLKHTKAIKSTKSESDQSLADDGEGESSGNVEEPLSGNQYVVGKIRERRLMISIENHIPKNEDYEYLVSWEGFGDEDDTWEPYEHLENCPEKIKEFQESIKKQRNLRGKRN